MTILIRVRGIVQGVGFRPFVWALAARFGITGTVSNDGEGVIIEAEGEAIEAFVAAITSEAPPLARISSLEVTDAPETLRSQGFKIIASQSGNKTTAVAPDAALCEACREEVGDPTARRFGYAFANCTHCGPRFSIIEAVPYDRLHTSMRLFEMCSSCRGEYEDPSDRRFHAQPIACPACGPRLSFWAAKDSPSSGDAIDVTVAALRSGKIIAIKGIGGFHLCCDATNEAAVALLRERKRRPDKPFALMARDVDMVAQFSQPTPADLALLYDHAAPIVLIKEKGAGLAASIAPRLNHLGWMLPYTPLHHLICKAMDRPLVMTSGNLSGEPQVIDNDEAFEKLKPFVDGFLLHDRPIVRRLDDSVVRSQGGQMSVIRRARGLAPSPLELPPGFEDGPQVLAFGGELKSALCVIKGKSATLSHHLGDLEDALSFTAFEKAVGDYQTLFEAHPEVLATDLHPHYRSTLVAEEMAQALDKPIIHVQHHHAHMAACMGENGWPRDGGKVLGLCFDGTGYGQDGTIWGGEFLLGDYRSFTRVGHLSPVRLAGGAAAITEPWRCLVGHLVAALGEAEANAWLEQTGIIARLADKPLKSIVAMIDKGFNAPQTTSMGRLFDAVGAAIGCAFSRISYEGQAAIEAESLAYDGGAVPFRFETKDVEGVLVLDPKPFWHELGAALAAGEAASHLSWRFHAGLAKACADMALKIATTHGAQAIALSGGVMQNTLLVEMVLKGLNAASVPVLTHKQVPANDGGLAYGQALVALAQSLRL